jgi:hypothetical protein
MLAILIDDPLYARQFLRGRRACNNVPTFTQELDKPIKSRRKSTRQPMPCTAPNLEPLCVVLSQVIDVNMVGLEPTIESDDKLKL